jgi:transposase
MNEGLAMNKQEEHRAQVLTKVLAGSCSLPQAAALLGVSQRQAYRLVAEFRSEGPRALVHGNRGRRPAHAASEEVRKRVVALAASTYAGFNHTHLTEMLAKHEDIDLSRATVNRILREAGVVAPRPKRRAKHRARRERYAEEGMLLQLDASHHDWLQGRGPWMALIGAIDDATSAVAAARFGLVEDSDGYFRLLHAVIAARGIPMALYSDRHGVFFHPTPTAKRETLADQLAGQGKPTQFSRAMADLGIVVIPANSPQAKGRIERLWGTSQDRLVSELRLAGITTLDESNAFLPEYLARHNQRFAVPWPPPHRDPPIAHFPPTAVSRPFSVHITPGPWPTTTPCASTGPSIRFCLGPIV